MNAFTRTTEVATLTGLLDLAAPDPARITLADIALKLATKPRWGGVLDPPLSVAQHSVMVANQLPPHLRIYGLLHDAHEAYLGDITTPVETLFGAMFRHALSSCKTRLDIVIREALGVPHPAIDVHDIVLNADLAMAATEWASLMPAACGANPIPAKPIRSIRVKCWAWPDAQAQFLAAVQMEIAMRSWEVAR